MCAYLCDVLLICDEYISVHKCICACIYAQWWVLLPSLLNKYHCTWPDKSWDSDRTKSYGEKRKQESKGLMRTKQELSASKFENFPAVMSISLPPPSPPPPCCPLKLDAGEMGAKTFLLPLHKVIRSREAQERFYPCDSPTKMSPSYWRSGTRDKTSSPFSVPRSGCCSVSFGIFYIWKNTPGLSLPRLPSKRSGLS